MKIDHTLNSCLQNRFAAFVWAVNLVLVTACVPDATVVISPVFPEDEPNLLGAVGVGSIVVTLTPQGGEAAEQKYTLTVGEKLRLTDVPPGVWTVSLSGLSGKNERAFGRSLPFRIQSGEGAQVPVFVGRSNSFNRVKLIPEAAADKLVDLTGHAAVEIQTGPEETRILVAGGERPDDDRAARRILLIDPASLTVEEFPTPMGCSRAHARATAVHHPIHGDAVVLSGGDDCRNHLDVFFARTKKLVSRALDCEVEDPTAAYAEVEQAGAWPGASTPPHTGRVVFPGSPSCILTVDPQHLAVSSAKAHDPKLSGSSLTPLGNGKIAAVSKDGVLAVFEASLPNDPPVMPTFDLWESGSSNRRLVPTDSGTKLIYLRANDRDTTSWSFVRLSGRSLGAVIDGDPLPKKDLPSGPVAVDASSLEATAVLFAGGVDREKNRTRATSLFYVAEFDEMPSWHKLEDEAHGHGTARPTLRTARAGHTVTPLSNRATWVVGGGATPAEVFVHGSGPVVSGAEEAAEPLVRLHDQEFVHRRPTITSLTIHDPLDPNLLDADSLGASAFTNAYTALLRKSDASAVLNLWASAGRGVGDGLVERRVPGTQGCLSIKLDFEMPPRGEVFGDLDGISVDGRWTTFPGGGVSQRNYLRSLTLDSSPRRTDARRVSATESAPELTPPPPEQRLFVPLKGDGDPDFENTSDGMVLGSGSQCAWRQFVRVGFDGLTRSEIDRTYAGVHVLVWLARGDDCSQGVIDSGGRYPDSENGNTCVDSIYDDYFGLPPRVESQKEQLRDMVHGISFDPRDFVVVLVQLPAHSRLKTGAASLEPGVDFATSGTWKAADSSTTQETAFAPAATGVAPSPSHSEALRRLYSTAKVLEEMSVRVIDGFVDDSGSHDSTEAAIDEIVDRVESQLSDLDPLQSCIPGSVLRSDPPSILFAEHLGPDGLYLPLNVVSTLSDDMARNISTLESAYAQDVKTSCRIHSLRDVDAPDLDFPRYRVESLSGEAAGRWHIATDSDRNGGCESGFLVRLSSGSSPDRAVEQRLRCEL